MFGIGPMEIIVVVLFALVFIGPKKLPDLARQFGRFFVKIRRVTNEVRSTIDDAIKEAEHDLLMEERQKLQALLEDQQSKARQAADSLLSDVGSQPQTDQAATDTQDSKNTPPLDTTDTSNWDHDESEETQPQTQQSSGKPVTPEV